MHPLNGFLLHHHRKIRSRELSGDIDSVRQLIKKGARVLFTPNHPTRTDPQLVGETISRHFGAHSSFMAAYDVFLESKVQAWIMQKMGCFSVDREGNDRKSLSTAIDILKQGDMALTIFPEGNTYQLNDRVTPILDGPAFISAKAQQALKDEAEVWVVPVSIKYTNLTDIRKRVWNSLKSLARDSKFTGRLDTDDAVGSVYRAGNHLISSYLSDRIKLDHKVTFEGGDPDQVAAELMTLTGKLTSSMEEELDLENQADLTILDRVRRIRAKIHQVRNNGNGIDESTREKYRRLAERAIFTFRLLPYVVPYFSEKPTLDRFAETVMRMKEDHYSKPFDPPGPRKALIHIGTPISLSQSLSDADGRPRRVIPKLTNDIECSIQRGIDHLNENNDEIGSQLI